LGGLKIEGYLRFDFDENKFPNFVLHVESEFVTSMTPCCHRWPLKVILETLAAWDAHFGFSDKK